MIQRIQSVYLLLGALAVVGLLFVDGLWSSAAVEAQPWYGPAVLVLGGVTAVGAVAAVFLYKDRKRQRQVIGLVQLLALVFTLVLFAGLYLGGSFVTLTAGPVTMTLVLLLGLPILAYLFFYLARRGVENDIALIRSMDRLR